MVSAFAAIVLLIQVWGLILAVDALMSSRTSQGTVAWVVTLLAFPIIGIPAYLIFGRSRFRGYLTARVAGEQEFIQQLGLVQQDLQPYLVPRPLQPKDLEAFESLAKLPFTHSNQIKLLINGEETFDDILRGIDEARQYVLVQFYIVNDDTLGHALQQCLINAVRRGLQVYFLYDEIGSYQLSDHYLNVMRKAGVNVLAFHSTRNVRNRFQLNFRNHRKIVISDGLYAWIGGHNVGLEYLGKSRNYPFWRDTHIRLSGPAVLGAQLSFMEDWHWVTDDIPELNWQPAIHTHNTHKALILPSGPSDTFETASLMMQHAMYLAKKRIWIASPYFVPDEGVQQALRLAALRGVDVRILIPEKPDKIMVYLSAFSFVPGILRAGVKIFRYQRGFLHQKVFLVDDYLSGVGTVNLDNRSFRLNFEVTGLIDSKTFAGEIAAMLEEDLAHSKAMSLEAVEAKPLWFKILSRAAYLTAPVL